MIRDWLLIGFVVVCLWGFWWWVCRACDVASELYAAWRESREDAQATKGTGS